MYSPIILLVYNRVEHTKKVVEALKKCDLSEQSALYVYSDGAKVGDEEAVSKVREYVNSIYGFEQVVVIERQENYGIEKSEVLAISEILQKYSSVIVMEDDILVTSDFLLYMNSALERYKAEKKVFYISGYSYLEKKSRKLPDSMLLKIPSTWGWGVWRDRWEHFDGSITNAKEIVCDKGKIKEYNFDNANKSWGTMLLEQYEKGSFTWDVAWYVSMFRQGGLVLVPNQSLVKNIGLDGSGIHKETRLNNKKKFEEAGGISSEFPNEIKENRRIRKIVKRLLVKQEICQKIYSRYIKLKKRLRW